MEIFLLTTLALVVLVLVAVGLWHLMFIRYEYTEVKKVKGTVVDMDFVPSRKTGKHSRSPERHEVNIRTELHLFEYDDEELYQRVRIDDEVEISYQEKWRYHKNRPDEKKFYDYRTIEIVNPKNRTITINDPK